MNVRRLPFDETRGIPIDSKSYFRGRPSSSIKAGPTDPQPKAVTSSSSGVVTTLSGRQVSKSKPYEPPHSSKVSKNKVQKSDEVSKGDPPPFTKKDDAKLLTLVKKFSGKGRNGGVSWVQILESFGNQWSKYFIQKRYDELTKISEAVVEVHDDSCESENSENDSSSESTSASYVGKKSRSAKVCEKILPNRGEAIMSKQFEDRLMLLEKKAAESAAMTKNLEAQLKEEKNRSAHAEKLYQELLTEQSKQSSQSVRRERAINVSNSHKHTKISASPAVAESTRPTVENAREVLIARESSSEDDEAEFTEADFQRNKRKRAWRRGKSKYVKRTQLERFQAESETTFQLYQAKQQLAVMRALEEY
jgi:hypothetical protein